MHCVARMSVCTRTHTQRGAGERLVVTTNRVESIESRPRSRHVRSVEELEVTVGISRFLWYFLTNLQALVTGSEYSCLVGKVSGL